jgi:hypothetical protein
MRISLKLPKRLSSLKLKKEQFLPLSPLLPKETQKIFQYIKAKLK